MHLLSVFLAVVVVAASELQQITSFGLNPSGAETFFYAKVSRPRA
jgi:hypothetical protein